MHILDIYVYAYYYKYFAVLSFFLILMAEKSMTEQNISKIGLNI